jgi:ArsR family transcriptional regulator
MATVTDDTCAPIRAEPIDLADAHELAGWFGVLGDPTRLRLISLLAAAGEACAACDLVEPLGVSQPTVSHHLKVLRENGFVRTRRDGRWVYYSLVPGRLDALSRALVGD